MTKSPRFVAQAIFFSCGNAFLEYDNFADSNVCPVLPQHVEGCIEGDSCEHLFPCCRIFQVLPYLRRSAQSIAKEQTTRIDSKIGKVVLKNTLILRNRTISYYFFDLWDALVLPEIYVGGEVAR